MAAVYFPPNSSMRLDLGLVKSVFAHGHGADWISDRQFSDAFAQPLKSDAGSQCSTKYRI